MAGSQLTQTQLGHGSSTGYCHGEAMVGTREDETALHFISTPAACMRQLWVIQSLVEAGAA